MLEFKVGDRVSFKTDDRPALCGVLTKYNKKTVTVITDNGEHWNVAPGLLTLAKEARTSERKQSNVIHMPNGEKLQLQSTMHKGINGDTR